MPREAELVGAEAMAAQAIGEVDDLLMRLPEAPRRGRVPDLLFVTSAHVGRQHPTYLDGPRDLAVKIISPDSVGRDRGEKVVEYEQAGIPEYWLADTEPAWQTRVPGIIARQSLDLIADGTI